MHATFRIQRPHFPAQTLCQALYGSFSTGWAAIDPGFAEINCLCIIPATRVSATGALGLGKPRIYGGKGGNGAVGVAGKI